MHTSIIAAEMIQISQNVRLEFCELCVLGKDVICGNNKLLKKNSLLRLLRSVFEFETDEIFSVYVSALDLAQNSNVQDAFVIAVEQQARERLERLSALKRIKPVDMTKLSQQVSDGAPTLGVTCKHNGRERGLMLRIHRKRR
jgi:hypothetical protein